MSATVVPLAPKSKSGNKRDIGWTVNYNTLSKKFVWSVTVHVKPQVFNGECGTMHEAQAEVDKILSRFR